MRSKLNIEIFSGGTRIQHKLYMLLFYDVLLQHTGALYLMQRLVLFLKETL